MSGIPGILILFLPYMYTLVSVRFKHAQEESHLVLIMIIRRAEETRWIAKPLRPEWRA